MIYALKENLNKLLLFFIVFVFGHLVYGFLFGDATTIISQIDCLFAIFMAIVATLNYQRIFEEIDKWPLGVYLLLSVLTNYFVAWQNVNYATINPFDLIIIFLATKRKKYLPIIFIFLMWLIIFLLAGRATVLFGLIAIPASLFLWLNFSRGIVYFSCISFTIAQIYLATSIQGTALAVWESNLAIRFAMVYAAFNSMELYQYLTGVGFGFPYRAPDYALMDHSFLYDLTEIAFVSNHNSLFDIWFRCGLLGLYFLYITFPKRRKFATYSAVIRNNFLYLIVAFNLIFNASLDYLLLIPTYIICIVLLHSNADFGQEKIMK